MDPTKPPPSSPLTITRSTMSSLRCHPRSCHGQYTHTTVHTQSRTNRLVARQVIKQVAMLEFDEEWMESWADFMLAFNLGAVCVPLFANSAPLPIPAPSSPIEALAPLHQFGAIANFCSRLSD